MSGLSISLWVYKMQAVFYRARITGLNRIQKQLIASQRINDWCVGNAFKLFVMPWVQQNMCLIRQIILRNDPELFLWPLTQLIPLSPFSSPVILNSFHQSQLYAPTNTIKPSPRLLRLVHINYSAQHPVTHARAALGCRGNQEWQFWFQVTPSRTPERAPGSGDACCCWA